MPSSSDRRFALLIQCAKLYFEQHLSQEDIAEALKISKASVWRLLREAKEKAHIEVKFDMEHLKIHDLESQLCKKYNLRALRILPPQGEQHHNLSEKIGKFAIDFLDDILEEKSKSTIALSGGSTIFHMVEQATSRPRNIQIFPLVMPPRSMELTRIDASVSVTILWAKSAPLAKGYVPGFSSFSQKQTQARIEEIRSRILDSVNLIFTSIGLPQSSKDGRQPNDSVGNINIINYNDIAEPLDSCVYGLSLEDLHILSVRENTLVIGMGGSVEKVQAIRALLCHRIVNALITDYLCAYDLLF